MPRFFAVVILALSLLPGAALAAEAPLRLHAWVDYFPAWLHEAFTKETGIPIVQSFFADNKSLHKSLAEQKDIVQYDVVTPSAEMAQQLIAEGLLLGLDRGKVPRLGDVDPWFADAGYDPGGIYSAALFWGGLGIVIDKRAMAPELAGRIKGYADLWLPELRGRLLLPNDFRSLMSVMLLTLGHGVNDFAHLPEAMQKLESLLPSVRLFDTVDQLESMSSLSTGVDAGVVWAREGYTDAEHAEMFTFIFAREGSPVWVDTLAVPANAANPEAAFAFINFVLRPDILARLGESSGYAVSVAKARALLPEEMRDNPLLYPPQSLREHFEPELMLPAEADELMRQWNRLRDTR